MRRDRFLQRLDQPCEALGIAIGPALDGHEIPAPAAANHVGRERPRRSREAQDRALRGCGCNDALHGVVDRREMPPLALLVEDRQRTALPNRLQARPLPLLEPEPDPERLGHHQDVREQDHAVEREATYGLERSLGRQCRVVAEVEEGPRPGPERTILRQISPRLAHQPERRRLPPLAMKNRQKRLVVSVHDRALACFPDFARLSSITNVLIKGG